MVTLLIEYMMMILMWTLMRIILIPKGGVNGYNGVVVIELQGVQRVPLSR